jgi:hypothetical protein
VRVEDAFAGVFQEQVAERVGFEPTSRLAREGARERNRVPGYPLSRRTKAVRVEDAFAGVFQEQVAERVGFGPTVWVDRTQVIHSTKRHKRQNRHKRRSGVHGGYTAPFAVAPLRLP